MSNIRILWADDEIEMLKPQILFLQEKGYEVEPVSNGQDALDHCMDPEINLIFLDEMMPGLSGLETLQKIKEKRPNIPIVMITKNETENLMEEAIGSQISDYLIKPVKSQQMLLTIKKLTDNKRLVNERTDQSYQRELDRVSSVMDMDTGGLRTASLLGCSRPLRKRPAHRHACVRTQCAPPP